MNKKKMNRSSSLRRSTVRKLSPMRALGAGLVAGALSISALTIVGTSAFAQAPRLMAPPLAADGTLSFADLVERVSPAVVSVLVEREVERPGLPSQFSEQFQFRFGDPRGRGRGGDGFGGPQTMQAEGSGFFIDRDGHVVTNNHVVEGADRVELRFSDGNVIPATIVGTDPATDLAVLKVDPKDMPKKQPFVQFAEQVNLRVGDWVVAVGNPFGLGGSVTSGIVSAIGGQNREGQYLDYIQIDAPINRGNSGGPTFDLKGRVVGVNTAIYSPNGGSVGIGFAIPAKVAKDTVAQLIANGSVTRGWLGVNIQDVTTEIAAALGRNEAKGALVADVLDGTPAAKAGLKSGDLVVQLDGGDIDSPRDLTRKVGSLPPGAKARVKIIRDGAEKTLNVTLGERDGVDQLAETSGANDNDSLAEDVGLQVESLTGDLRDQFRVPDDVDGVLVTGVKSGSPAASAGLAPGIVILKVDGDEVSSRNALKAKIAAARKDKKEAVLLQMQIGQSRQYGALRVDDK